MGKSQTRAGVLLSILLASSVCAFALDPSLDVSQYAHTAWKIREGFTKGIILSMAQTRRVPLPLEGRSFQGLIGGGSGTLLFANGIRQLQGACPYRLGILNLVNGKAQAYPLPATARKFEPLGLFRDRIGGLWTGTANQGLLHVYQGSGEA